jgi:hypothetical protein
VLLRSCCRGQSLSKQAPLAFGLGLLLCLHLPRKLLQVKAPGQSNLAGVVWVFQQRLQVTAAAAVG